MAEGDLELLPEWENTPLNTNASRPPPSTSNTANTNTNTNTTVDPTPPPPQNKKTETDFSEVDTSQYLTQTLHLMWYFRTHSETVTEALADSQQSVATLREEIGRMSSSIHTLQRQIKGMETLSRNSTSNNNPDVNKQPSNTSKPPNPPNNNNNNASDNSNKNGNNNKNKGNNNNNQSTNKGPTKQTYANAAGSAGPSTYDARKENGFTKVQHKKKPPRSLQTKPSASNVKSESKPP